MAEQSSWILTGLSGAGKTVALRALEGSGVTCVDNLPLPLLREFATSEAASHRVAVIDSRQDGALRDFEPQQLGRWGVRVLYLDASDDVLRRRLGESTRPHPCAVEGNVLAAIAAERELLTPLRAAADVTIDTTDLTALDLAARVVELLGGRGVDIQTFHCTLSSFGFKHGPPRDADWMVDVRLLPNPFWDEKLRQFTGLDSVVQDYVLASELSQEFVDRLQSLLQWTIAQSRARGRMALHLAVGCTGGRHRSVAVAEALAARLNAPDVHVVVRHRDVRLDDPR